MTHILHDVQETKEGNECHTAVESHKEERKTHLKEDAVDRQKKREALPTCVDVFNVSKHPVNGIINIYSGNVVDEPSLNIHDALKMGSQQCRDSECNRPTSVYKKLKRCIRTMTTVTKKAPKDQA